MSIAVRADLQARLSPQAFTRLYARNGGSTVDTVFADLCLAEAESEFRMICAAAFPDGFTSPVDVAIVGAVCDIANAKAAARHLSATEQSGYALAGKAARDFARRLSDDNRARPTTGQLARPPALPTASPPSSFWGDPGDGTWKGF